MSKALAAPIILSGSISIDRIMTFGGLYRDLIAPDKIHVLSLSVLLDHLENTRGGTAANIAYSLALLGEHPVLLGSLGHDAAGYLADLGKIGIETSHVTVSSLPTATFTVLTDAEDNQVGGFYPGAMSDSAALNLDPWLTQNPFVVISAGDPALMQRLAETCREHKLRYAYDVGQQVSNLTPDVLKSGILGAEILFVNDYELGVITRRTGLTQAELEQRLPIIVTTLGAVGSRLSGTSVPTPVTVPAVPDLEPVDPTGAGDAYRAGFLYAYLRSAPLKTCAALGSVIASYTVVLRGTQTHTFTFAKVKELYYSVYGEELNL